jgi:hypothetical protein
VALAREPCQLGNVLKGHRALIDKPAAVIGRFCSSKTGAEAAPEAMPPVPPCCDGMGICGPCCERPSIRMNTKVMRIPQTKP